MRVPDFVCHVSRRYYNELPREGSTAMTPPAQTRRAWCSASVGPARAWYFDLPATVLKAIESTLHRLRRQPTPLTELQLADVPLGDHAAELSPVLTAIEEFPGFVVIRGLPAEYSAFGQPLTDRQRSALDRFDQVLNQPALRVEFNLAPRDMMFVNNRWILHNRTAFEDFEEPPRKRHLVRLWLESHSAGDR